MLAGVEVVARNNIKFIKIIDNKESRKFIPVNVTQQSNTSFVFYFHNCFYSLTYLGTDSVNISSIIHMQNVAIILLL